jgi:Tfp pilus assembly protein PilP
MHRVGRLLHQCAYKPWSWSPWLQRVCWVGAVVLGLLVSAPIWWDAWKQWQLARDGVELLKSQQEQLKLLEDQNKSLREALTPHSRLTTYVNTRELIAAQTELVRELDGFDRYVRKELKRPIEWLEQFELSQLSYAGRIWQQGLEQALFRIEHPVVSSSGQIYGAAQGGYVGRNFGQVRQIESHAVLVSELVLDPTKGWIRQEVWIPLGE